MGAAAGMKGSYQILDGLGEKLYDVQSLNTPEPPFIAAAEAFIAAERGALGSRLLRWYFGCPQEELDQALGKIYCESLPENTYRLPEPALKSALGLALYPAFILARRRWLWRAEPVADWNFETIDPPYFLRWFSEAFAALPGRKRLTPRAPFDLPGHEVTLPHWESVRLRDAAALLMLAAPVTAAFAAMGRRHGLNLLRAVRNTVSLYTVFRGYFARYPCRNFFTYDDESNPPARYLAFRRACPGVFAVVQNGERNLHPHIAYGRMDRYLLFGPAYEAILRAIKTRSERFVPVGALSLNERRALADSERGAPVLYDVLFVDQGVYPLNGLDERSGRSLETIMERLGELARRHPRLRVAYQMRPYPAGREAYVALIQDTVRRRAGPEVAILPNADGAASYRNALKSELVMTFESTLGFEAMMLGRKALFVNFSGDPTESLCPDPAYQHDDPAADFGRFEAKVLGLLAAPPAGVPEAARRRHWAFDGRVQERIAAALTAP